MINFVILALKLAQILVCELFRLEDKITISFNVNRYSKSHLDHINSDSNFVFIIDDKDNSKLLNIYPKYFHDFDEFKVILLEELNNTNFIKSTLWFKWIGIKLLSEPPYMAVYRNTTSINNNAWEFHEQDALNWLIDRNSELEKIGEMSTFSDLIVPIGSNLYNIKLIDDSRMLIKLISNSKYNDLSVIKTDDKEIGVSRIRTYKIPSKGISFETTYNCGATGRHCEFEIVINGKKFLEHEGFELGYRWYWSDFPIFVSLHKKGIVNYVVINPEIKVREYIEKNEYSVYNLPCEITN